MNWLPGTTLTLWKSLSFWPSGLITGFGNIVMRGRRGPELVTVFRAMLRESTLHCRMLGLLVLYPFRVLNSAMVLLHILQRSRCNWEAPDFPLWRVRYSLLRPIRYSPCFWTTCGGTRNSWIFQISKTRATGCFLNRTLARQQRLPLTKLDTPLSVTALDGLATHHAYQTTSSG